VAVAAARARPRGVEGREVGEVELALRLLKAWARRWNPSRRHPYADDVVRRPRGERALTRSCAGAGHAWARARAEANKDADAGQLRPLGQKWGSGPVKLRTPFSFKNQISDFLNHFKFKF
jgi:hypothetical protein